MIEPGWAVVDCDGDEAGKVAEVLGDTERGHLRPGSPSAIAVFSAPRYLAVRARDEHRRGLRPGRPERRPSSTGSTRTRSSGRLPLREAADPRVTHMCGRASGDRESVNGTRSRPTHHVVASGEGGRRARERDHAARAGAREARAQAQGDASSGPVHGLAIGAAVLVVYALGVRLRGRGRGHRHRAAVVGARC